MALAREIGRMLQSSKATLAVAESCTGGRLADRITAVPGSSSYFRGGIVAYANDVKSTLLGVPRNSLVQHGAVSAEVARQMARGVRRLLGADYAIGVTGIAGPGGGSWEKPVGTVFVAIVGPREALGRGFRFRGSRSAVKGQSCIAALKMLKKLLRERGNQ
ncbi:MAG: CinA family protein [Kiritimatiellae bacterium]|nr:CinA family protein [Kiritimatiellia bacterium]